MEQDTLLFEGLVRQTGYYNLEMTPLLTFLIAATIVLVAVILFYMCKKLLIPLIKKITESTKFTWDDHLFNEKVTTSICHLVPPLVFYLLVPLAFRQRGVLFEFVMTVIAVYLTAMFTKLVIAFISSFQAISAEHDNLKNKPLKGVYQMMKIIVICVGVIISLGIVLDKDMSTLLAGLGASAAVLSLVFKDTIMGLVAGVQLSANDMLRPGDWIKMDKYGADGIVYEVSLTTVKVRNWDMTIVTLPPYALVSDSFQNWRGMWENKGRRITKQILIDTSTVRFCTNSELEEFQSKGWLSHDDSAAQDGPVVNLSVYRNYIMQYLISNDKIINEMLMMVRQLEMNGDGLPLQIYCFARTINLTVFEDIQSEVMEHVMAMASMFGLRIFQRPSGNDIKGLITDTGGK